MLKKLLITGANGNLGAVCRDRLTHIAETVRVSARHGLGEARENEEIVYCDLGDKAAVEAMVEGCDGIVHMGGQATEAPWETIRNANIDGMFNLYEAARKSSVTPRIIPHSIGAARSASLRRNTAVSRSLVLTSCANRQSPMTSALTVSSPCSVSGSSDASSCSWIV